MLSHVGMDPFGGYKYSFSLKCRESDEAYVLILCALLSCLFLIVDMEGFDLVREREAANEKRIIFISMLMELSVILWYSNDKVNLLRERDQGVCLLLVHVSVLKRNRIC